MSTGIREPSGDGPSPRQAPWASPAVHGAALTAREWDVLTILVTGASTREISARLRISPRTVANHLASIYGKLGIHTRSEAVARALGTTEMSAGPDDNCSSMAGDMSG